MAGSFSDLASFADSSRGGNKEDLRTSQNMILSALMDAPNTLPKDYSPPESGEELLSRYAAGERYFGPDKSDDRKVAALSKAVLEKANLSGADLSEADLTGAQLARSNLTNVKLTRAQLSDADLTGADCTDCVVDDAMLDGAILSHANVTRMSLGKAASLGRAVLKGAVLSKADLSNVDLHEADLSCAILTEANLSEADLSGANLTEAILRWADLQWADLSNADLSKAIAQEVGFFHADLQGTIFRGALLRGSSFEEADIRGADLADADLSGADFSKAALTATDDLLVARWDTISIDGRSYVRKEIESGEEVLPFGMGNPLRFIFQASTPLTADEVKTGFELIEKLVPHSRGSKLALELSTVGQRFLVESRGSKENAARIGLAVLQAQQLSETILAQKLLESNTALVEHLDQIVSILADSRLDEIATRRSLEGFLNKMDLRQVQFHSEEAVQDFLTIAEKAGLQAEKMSLGDRVIHFGIRAQQKIAQMSPTATILAAGLAAHLLDVPGGFDAGAAVAGVYISGVGESGKAGPTD